MSVVINDAKIKNKFIITKQINWNYILNLYIILINNIVTNLDSKDFWFEQINSYIHIIIWILGICSLMFN